MKKVAKKSLYYKEFCQHMAQIKLNTIQTVLKAHYKKLLIQIVNMAHICKNDMLQIKDMFQVVATWLQFSSEEYWYKSLFFTNFILTKQCQLCMLWYSWIQWLSLVGCKIRQKARKSRRLNWVVIYWFPNLQMYRPISMLKICNFIYQSIIEKRI